MMEYRCEDLSGYGVVLVPPSSPEYAAFLTDIQNRIANPIPGSAPPAHDFEDPSAPTVILCNRSQTGIAALSWIWKFELDTGRTARSSVSAGGVPSVLAPFGLDERMRKLYGYWHGILPGSKRGIRGSRMFGDNADVRPPQPDEAWKGGGYGVGGGSRDPRGPLKSVTVALDGVIFLDGGFAGPDTLYNFDRMTSNVDAHLQVARIRISTNCKATYTTSAGLRRRRAGQRTDREVCPTHQFKSLVITSLRAFEVSSDWRTEAAI
jgi:hypothetical protein